MNDSRGFIVPQTLIVLQFVLVFDVCQWLTQCSDGFVGDVDNEEL